MSNSNPFSGVTVTIRETPPDELAKLRALAPSPPAGLAPRVVETAADRLAKAEAEFAIANNALVDESEVERRIDLHTKAANDAAKEIPELEAMLRDARQKVQSETALLQGARALKTDNRVAVEARGRFDRAVAALEAARTAAAEEQAQETAQQLARAAIEKENQRGKDSQDHGTTGAARTQEAPGGSQAAEGSGGGSGGPAAQAGQAEGGAQAPGNGQA
jgi:hypothetical protein